MHVRRQLLPATPWLTYGPRHFFRRGAFRSRVIEIPIKELRSRRRVSVWYRRDAYLSPLALRFIDILKQTARSTTVKRF